MIGGISVIALSILPLIYALNTRSRDEYLYPSLIIGIVFVFIMILPYFRMGIKKAFEDEWVLNFVIFKAVFLIPTAGLFYYSLFVSLYDLSIFIYKKSSGNLTIVVPTFSALALGIMLYKFRLKQRVLYGVSEIMVGVTVTVFHARTSYPAGHLDNPELYIAILTAGIYLIVRGLDNIDQGIKSKSNNPLLRWLFGSPPDSK